MKPEQIREQITKTIIETLEKGDVPFWKRGWSDDPNALGVNHLSDEAQSFAILGGPIPEAKRVRSKIIF